MDAHEATFEIQSKTDAYAVERITEGLYNSLREESRTLRKDGDDATTMLAAFEAMREAASTYRPGQLTVVFTQREEPFEE